MGGGSPSPRFARKYRISGQTGSRKMPGQSQSVKSGNCNGYFSYLFNHLNTSFNSANNLPNNIASTSWQNSNPTSSVNKPLRQGIIVSTIDVGGVGGGPNEEGSNTGFNGFAKDTYNDPRPTFNPSHNGSTTTAFFSDESHYTGSTTSTTANQTFVDKNSRFTNNNFPFFFVPNPTFAGVQPNSIQAKTCGGGGWGAAGGSMYGGFTAPSVDRAGGAGGPAIKTNGNTVTFSAGNTTSRVFGSVVS